MMIEGKEVEVEQFEGTEEEWYALIGFDAENPKTYVWIVEHPVKPPNVEGPVEPLVFVKKSSDPDSETETIKHYVDATHGESPEAGVRGPYKAQTNW